MDALSLNFCLYKFIQEVANKKGGRYPRRTLYGIVCGLKRHVEELRGASALNPSDYQDRRQDLAPVLFQLLQPQAAQNNLTVFSSVIPKSGRKYSRSNSHIFAMTLIISQLELGLSHTSILISKHGVLLFGVSLGIKTYPPGQNEHHLLALDQFN